MEATRSVLAEAKFSNTKTSETDNNLTWSDLNSAPLIERLYDYMGESTQKFYTERRRRLGRAYTVSSITKLSDVESKDNTIILMLEIKALSTSGKMQPIIGVKDLKELRIKSRNYTLRFIIKLNLTNYLEKMTIYNLRKDFKTARAVYFCNCMMFNYSGANYRAKVWSMYPQRIPDPKMGKIYGANSKVCKHIAHTSKDFSGFISPISKKLKDILIS